MIRDATENDMEKCTGILADNQMWARYERTLSDARDFLKKELKSGNHLWVFVENEAVIGFVGCIEKGMMGEFPYVRVLAVERNHRGRGIGSYLLNHVEKTMFTRTHLLFMMVSDFNDGALRLYRRLGYETIGAIREYKKEGIDEYLLVKRRP